MQIALSEYKTEGRTIFPDQLILTAYGGGEGIRKAVIALRMETALESDLHLCWP